MAFLDNSGDIVLDAVLTDTGRMRLARGDGSFKITKFALIRLDDNNFLNDIVEKPPIESHDSYRNKSNQLFVSMNIFSFRGADIYPFLKKCIINVERDEKELPEAVRSLVRSREKSMFSYKVKEHLKDLTSAHDINTFNKL